MKEFLEGQGSLWIAAVPAGAYLIYLIARFGDVLRLIYSNSDAAWAQVLTQSLAEAPNRGLVKVGEAPHLTTLWFLEITRRFPFRQFVWDVAPFVVTLAGLGLVAWACTRAAGRWAGGMTVVLGLAAGPAVLATTLPEGMRSHTWFANSAMAAVLVFWTTRPAIGSARKNVAIGLAVGVFAGLTLASDPLFLVTGLVPFAGAAALAWLKTRSPKQRATAITAGGAAAVALVGARLIESWMHSAGYRKTYMNEGFSFATLPQIVENLQSFAGNALLVVNGSFFEQPVGLRSGASLAMAVLGIAAVGCPAARLGKTFMKRGEQPGDRPAAELYLSFWGLSVLTLAAGYVLTSVASGKGQLRIPSGTGDEATRYVVPLFYAAAASVPLWAARFPPRRLFVSAAAGLFALLSLASVASLMENQPLLATKSRGIAAYLSSRGVEKGYAAYWDSHSLTLSAKGKPAAYPVFHCHQNKPLLCPFVVNVRTDWYRPDAKRTFLLTDPTVPGALSPPDSGFGTPTEVRRFGKITVYIYDRDIVERFSKGCGGRYFC